MRMSLTDDLWSDLNVIQTIYSFIEKEVPQKIFIGF